MEALRFCMITTFYPPYAMGGDATYVYNLSRALTQRGHSVDVIHSVDSYRTLSGGRPPSSHPDLPGVTVHRLESRLGPVGPLATYLTGFPVFNGPKIRRILADGNFDVIHFHNISLVGGPMVLSYGSALKLYTMHEHWLICPMHVLFKYGREPCESPDCFRCTLAHRRPPQLWRYTPMLRRALRHIDSFISPSEFTLRRHREAGLDIPIEWIPCFTSLPSGAEEPDAAIAARLPKEPFFLFVGRLEKLKGLQTVIPVIRRHERARLVIAGDGDYADELRQLAEGCDRIQFLGRVGAEDLGTLYSRALAVIVPSITYETFGQVVIEAFAHGAPVIARDLGPLPELIRESGGGLLFHDDDTLTGALNSLQTDQALRTRLGAVGHEAAKRLWTEEVFLTRYFGLIDRLHHNRPSRAA